MIVQSVLMQTESLENVTVKMDGLILELLSVQNVTLNV